MTEKRESIDAKKPPKPPVQKKSNNLEINVEINVSQAIAGLKAVQREAKETVKALKEVESYRKVEEDSNHKPTKAALWIRNMILVNGLNLCKSLTPEQVDTIISLHEEYIDITCPICGSKDISTTELLSSEEPYYKSKTCNQCGFSKSIEKGG